MNHEQALNMMLANSCHNTDAEGNDIFMLEGHCLTFRVTARLVSTLETIQYDIVNVEIPEEL